MKDFFKSRFFIIVLIIALILVIVPSVLSVMGLSMYVRDAVNVMLSPFQTLLTTFSDAMEGYTAYFTEFDRLKEENKQLKEELAAAQDKIYDAQELEDTLNFLYDYVELKREHIDFMFEPADITGHESGNYMTVFRLNKGTDHGITADMPVISSDFVVGYIVEVGSNWSKAVTLLESASSVGAYIARTGQLGVVEGNFSLVSQGLCEMKYIPADADVRVGDRVMSSGLGSVYPKGLVIGYVTEVTPDAYSRTLIAKIKPAVTFDGLSKVMVIVDYDIYTE